MSERITQVKGLKCHVINTSWVYLGHTRKRKWRPYGLPVTPQKIDSSPFASEKIVVFNLKISHASTWVRIDRRRYHTETWYRKRQRYHGFSPGSLSGPKTKIPTGSDAHGLPITPKLNAGRADDMPGTIGPGAGPAGRRGLRQRPPARQPRSHRRQGRQLPDPAPLRTDTGSGGSSRNSSIAGPSQPDTRNTAPTSGPWQSSPRHGSGCTFKSRCPSPEGRVCWSSAGSGGRPTPQYFRMRPSST